MDTMRWYGLIGLLLVILSSGCSQVNEPEPMNVLAGSELKDLEPLLGDIEDCTRVDLAFRFTGTLDGAEELAAGGDYDLAWFSHGKYLSLLESTGSRIVAQEKIMLSPVVLGIKESKLRALGWQDTATLTWRDIAARAAAGELRYGMANPSSSNSGFTALMGVAAALSGGGEVFDTAQLDIEALQGFLSGHSLTAGSSGWLAEAYVREQAHLDGLINYESVLLQLNGSGRLREPLRIIYPQEGIITADYPLMLLDESRRDGYDRLVACLRSPEIQTRLMEQTRRRPVIPQVRPDSRFPDQLLVELPFPRSIGEIDALLFAYLDEHSKPSHTIFVLDTSGSMEGQRIASLRHALSNLTGVDQSLTGQFARFRARETVVMLPFNGAPLPPTTFTIETADRDSRGMIALRDYIKGLNAHGGTAIYEALVQAYRMVDSAVGEKPDRFYSIVLLTDGANMSEFGYGDFAGMYRQLPETAGNIRVFPILFGDSNVPEMEAVAELTGGRTFDAHKHSLAAVFKKIRGYQ